jgi:solute carrier family 25 iron transporter 28/37
MQSLVPDPKADYRSVKDAFNTIIRHEGLLRTMKGAPIVVMGAGPAHAFYFACYEYLKKTLSGGQRGNHLVHGRYDYEWGTEG